MASETRMYTNIDRAKADRLRAAIGSYVQLPEGDSGAIESQGIKGRYAYDSQAKTLALTLDEVPFFIPRSIIWSTLERALED